MPTLDIASLLDNEKRELNIPSVSLDSPLISIGVYGTNTTDVTRIGARPGNVVQTIATARLGLIPGNEFSEANVWHTFVELSGSGYFNNLGVGGNLRPVRVTVDGETQVAFLGANFIEYLTWGNHPSITNSRSVDGWYLYTEGLFDENTDEYKSNFVHGAVRFNSSLKVEFLNTNPFLSQIPIFIDYIMDEELV